MVAGRSSLVAGERTSPRGYRELELFTHAIGGLFENDFIMAAKINELEETQ